jgi:diazepam-binding inhibitor (GABA receptor modulating acyl-CoA-binding protein)
MNSQNYPLAQYFEDACEKIKIYGKSMSTDDLQVVYGLYKQATVGDVNIPEPSFIYFTEKAKWKAWNGNKGKSQDQAKHEYVTYCLKFLPDEVKNNYK